MAEKGFVPQLSAIRKISGASILIADAGAALPQLCWFDADWWKSRGKIIGQAHSGRGVTHFVQAEETVWVLRHYWRGGLVARLVADRYLWLGLERTRAWREFALTAHLYAQGLPVPRPVAAHVQRCGFFTYRADLITERLEGVRELTEHLQQQALPAAEWRGIGALVARFHRAGVYHHDLNCDNILRRSDGQLYVLDFDRGGLRQPAAAWQQAGLERLKRSLLKRQRQARLKYFSESDWAALLQGYQGAVSA